LNADTLTVTVDFRDWKWLSNYKRFSTTIDDLNVIAGTATGNMTLNFAELEQSDS
jgi:hypothetical protein